MYWGHPALASVCSFVVGGCSDCGQNEPNVLNSPKSLDFETWHYLLSHHKRLQHPKLHRHLGLRATIFWCGET